MGIKNSRFFWRENENCFSILYTPLGAKKKYVRHILNYVRHILKYLRDNFRLVVNLLFGNGQKQHYIQGVFPGAVFWLC